MAFIPAVYDWTLKIGTTFRPAIEIELVDLTGGQSEFAAWDTAGNLLLWMGTAGRTAPSPAPPVVGALSISVTGAGPNLLTTIQGSAPDSQTGAFPGGSFVSQWDTWDAAGVHDRILDGNLISDGRAMP